MDPDHEGTEPATSTRLRSWRKIHPGRVFLAAVCMAGAIYFLAPAVFFVQSQAAITNAPVVPIWSPIPGQLHMPQLVQGSLFRDGATLMTIENHQVDNSAVTDVETRLQATNNKIAELEREIQILEPRRVHLRRDHAMWLSKQEASLAFELQQQQRIFESSSIRETTMKAEQTRYRKLMALKYLSPQRVDQAEREYQVISSAVDHARLQMQRIKEEQAALRSGLQLRGEDRTKTLQLLEETELNIAVARNQLLFQQAEATKLKEERTARTALLARQTHATVIAPFKGVVWKLFAADASYVTPNNEIVQLADCDQLFVSALFPQRYLDDLVIGQRVSVKIVGLSDWNPGWIRQIGGWYESDKRVAYAVNLKADKTAPLHAIIHFGAQVAQCLIGARAIVRVEP